MNEDVRYRLSAEGVAEVVAAFRKVQTEALRSTNAAKGGFSGFGRALSGVGGVITGVVAAIGGISLTRLINEAADLGEQLQNLKLRFSSSAQDLSVLDVALKKSGSSLIELAPQLTRLMASTKEASRDLSGEVADNFRAAGVSTREIQNFAKQDLAGRLVTLANALQRIPEGPQRADAAIKALGLRAAALIPILEQIGTQGFAKMTEEAQRLAAVLTDEMVAATGAVNDSFDDLKIQSVGLAAQFVSGLAPAFTKGMAAMTSELTAGAQGWRTFGELVGITLGWLIAQTSVLIDSWHTMAIESWKSIIRLGDATKALARGDLEEVKLQIDSIGLSWEKAEEDQKKRAQVAFDRFKNGPPPVAGAAPGPTTDEAEIAAQARAAEEASTRARNAARRAAAESELALAKAGFKLQENEAEAAFRDNLTTLREYYDDRRRIITDGLNAEIVSLQKQRVIAAADKEKGLAEVQKIDGQIARLALERRDQIDDLAAKEIEAYRQLAQEQLELDRTVAEARGEHHAIALAEIETQIAKLDEILAKQGGDEATNQAKLRDAREVLSLAAEFDQLSADAARSLDDFSRARAEIERQAGVGLLSQAEANERIAALERDRLAQLRAISQELLEVAEATGNPEKIARARDFAASVDEISVAVRAQNDMMRRLASEGIDTARGALEDFLATGINKGPTFIGVLSSIGAAVQQLTAKFIALQIFSGILGLFGGSAAKDDKAFSFGSVTGRYAGGGRIKGPGTGTSDSILARLGAGKFIAVSNDEYITNAKATAKNLPVLEAINAGMTVTPVTGLPHYASGGLVDAAGISGSAGRAGGERLESTLNVGLDDGLFVRWAESPAGQRVIVRTIGKSRRSVSAALGR